MKRRGLALSLATAASVIAMTAVGAVAFAPSVAAAQKPPADLNVLPPVPTDYTPKKTPWGDYDFRGMWPIENLNGAHVMLQRPKQYGNRQYKDAIATFKGLLAARPDYARAPESQLAIANCQIELKDVKLAKKTLQDLIKAFPGTDAAQAAKERLAALR